MRILFPALGWRDYSMEWNYSEYGDVKVRIFSDFYIYEGHIRSGYHFTFLIVDISS